MIVFPNAKINLGLRVVEKRPDGYHNLETVFLPTRLCDVLEIVEVPDAQNPIEFKATGLQIDGNPDDNLIVKAIQLLKKDYDFPAVSVHLHKIIPFGAGLGGGSSDAAFALKMCNELFSLNLTEEQLIQYASRLGSDCAFFIKNKAALGLERGDVLQELNFSLDNYSLKIIVPPIHVSTAQAYAGVVPQKSENDLITLLKQPIETWKGTIHNDFEKSVFEKFPRILDIKNHLYEKGAVYASMSGSGSSVFGIFDNSYIAKNDDFLNDCFVSE